MGLGAVLTPGWKPFLTSALLLATGAVAAYQHFGSKSKQVHTLQAPLLLTGGGTSWPLYLLPPGTTMYLDQSYPEGFTRYIIYVNVDRFPLETGVLSDPTAIRPLTAYPMEKTDLRRLLDRNPVTKRELAAILKSDQLTKEEIRELLSEYSQ